MEYAYTVIIEAHDPRDDAAERIQLEIARHLAVIFGAQFRGVTNGHSDQASAR
jgi:hypothetical protein